MKKLLLMVAAVALLGVAPASAATFTLDNYTIDAHDLGDGLLIETENIAPQPTSFDLNVGQTHSFNLFKIWTNETDVDGGPWWDPSAVGEDEVPYPINVGLTFSQPTNFSGGVGGDTYGVSIFGLWEEGNVSWNSPVNLAFGSTGLLRVWLEDETFNGDWGGLNDGRRHGANVKAKFKYVSADTPAAVPEPASMLLFGSGLAAGAAAYRRRRAQKAEKA